MKNNAESLAGASLEEIAKRYRDLALAWAAASGRPKQANRLFTEHHRYYKSIRELESGRAAIVSLLTDSERPIRLLAASHALPFDPDRAVPVLETLKVDGGLIGFTALNTLNNFRSGTLNLDW